MDSVQQRSEIATPGNSGRMVLLLIAGIPVTVILAATWLWYFVARGDLDLVGSLGTANSGALLRPPRQALDAGWENAAGEPFSLPDEPKWVLVIVLADNDDLRKALLYRTRQIHMALGKTMGRVERALVTPAAPAALTLDVAALSDGRPLPDDFATYLEREQRGLSVWSSSGESFAELFREAEGRPDTWYLMDPAGWVMMRYDDAVDYKDVIGDLKFLLKNSNG